NGNGRKFLHGLLHSLFDPFTDHVLSESRYKVFYATGDPHAVRVLRNETDGVADGIAPQTRITVNDDRILTTEFHFLNGEPCRIFGSVFIQRDEFEKDSAVQQQQQSFIVL